jgi:hypothetical protein
MTAFNATVHTPVDTDEIEIDTLMKLFRDKEDAQSSYRCDKFVTIPEDCHVPWHKYKFAATGNRYPW